VAAPRKSLARLCVSQDPGQVLRTWLFADSRLRPLTRVSEGASLSLDRNWCARVRVPPVAVLLSTLQLSRYYLKQVLLASLPPSRDR
jgi:hypothetical protein